MLRSAAAVTKVLGGVPDKPLLTHEELIAPQDTNGGIVLVGSHVNKTTQQLKRLRRSECPLEFIRFDQHLVLKEGGLEGEVARVVALAQENISRGRSVVVFTRRERLDLDTDDKEMCIRDRPFYHLLILKTVVFRNFPLGFPLCQHSFNRWKQSLNMCVISFLHDKTP